MILDAQGVLIVELLITFLVGKSMAVAHNLVVFLDQKGISNGPVSKR
jgi:hypothetical protein